MHSPLIIICISSLNYNYILISVNRKEKIARYFLDGLEGSGFVRDSCTCIYCPYNTSYATLLTAKSNPGLHELLPCLCDMSRYGLK